MMAGKDGFPEGCSVAFAQGYESEGSGGSERIDTEIAVSRDSVAPRHKWVDLNSASRDGFDVPVQVLSWAKLSQPQKNNLVLRLRSELEKIRVLKKKFGLQKTNAVTLLSSNDIRSDSNVEKGNQTVNTKKLSGLAAGSVVKPNSSSWKERGCNRGKSGRFKSMKQSSVSDANATLLKQCENLLKKLMSHQFGWVFNDPVDVVKWNIPDYFNVIKHPMDLGTVRSRLASGHYSSPLDFVADVRLTFSNAKTYNPPGHNVYTMAETMSKFFEVRWKSIGKKLSETSSQSVPGKSGSHNEIEVVKSTGPAKKRKISPHQHLVMPERVNLRMTDEEKHKLGRELEAMLGDLPHNIIDFLREQSSNGGQVGEDEIEVDIDDLSDDTLFTLRKLLDDHLHEKQKNVAKAEPCEIELHNDFGLSTSSMQVDKGNDVEDDDTGIEVEEPPVSSYVPVDTDAGLRSNKCITTGISDNKSGSNGPSDAEVEAKCLTSQKLAMEKSCSIRDLCEKTSAEDLAEGNEVDCRLDQLEQSSQEKPNSDESDSHQEDILGESAPLEREVSPEKLYRAAILKNRFADTILKAREKTLSEGDKGDLEKVRREREKLEMQKIREKARLQAEAKAAEAARRRAEAEAAAEAKRKREVERAAFRQALSEMEKTVEINENSQFLEDLEMLRAGSLEQVPSSADETSPDHLPGGFDGFKFEGGNPLEQLGLYMKVNDDEEEDEPPSNPDIVHDVEEGEIDLSP